MTSVINSRGFELRNTQTFYATTFPSGVRDHVSKEQPSELTGERKTYTYHGSDKRSKPHMKVATDMASSFSLQVENKSHPSTLYLDSATRL